MQHTNRNTMLTYDAHIREFEAFCAAEHLAACPALPSTVARFITNQLDKRRRPHSYVGSVKSAIKHLHAMHGKSVNLAHESILAVQRCAKAMERVKSPKRPLQIADVLQIMRLQEKSTTDRRDKLMVLLMFYGLLRRSEAVSLLKDDVWVDTVGIPTQKGLKSTEALFIKIRKSKTDQSGGGTTIIVSSQEQQLLCPVLAFKNYAATAPESKFLFFNTADPNKPLSGSTPNFRVKEFVRRIGLDPAKYGSHSCRRGGATAAAAKGIPMEKLKLHGRWKSDAVWDYIQPTTADLLCASVTLGEAYADAASDADDDMEDVDIVG